MNTLTNKLLVLVAMATVLVTVPVTGKAEGLTQEQGNAILQELKQIRGLLQKQQTLFRQNIKSQPIPNPIVKLTHREPYVLGKPDAPITLVEFTDYQCPYCSRFHTNTFPQIKKQFIDTGKVRFVSRDLPLGFHKQAMPAARAARCAGEQGKYWELRHVLSSNPKNLSKESIIQYVQEQDLDIGQFQDCFESNKYTNDIQQDMADARAVGLTGTPGFVVGLTSQNGSLEGLKIKGAQPFASFERQIKKILVGKGTPTLVKRHEE